MSTGPETYRPIIVGINILIAIIVFFFRKRLSILFLANSIICYLIFSLFCNHYIENHPYSTTEFTFQIDFRRFKLKIDKNPDYFMIEEIILRSEDSLITMGTYENNGAFIEMTSMKDTIYYYDNKLIGLSIGPDEIELNRIE